LGGHSNAKWITFYLGWYLRHPALAELHISDFNIKTKMVPFWKKKAEAKIITLWGFEIYCQFG